MTERLYYRDPTLLEFDARVVEAAPAGDRLAVVLDRSAFYPTSGGQVFDTGRLSIDGREVTVVEVADREADEAVVHFIAGELAVGASVHGVIDAERRRDHMQQHTGQHVISAAFVKLYNFATVSFHMGAESCTVDLDTQALSPAQVMAAEKLANEVIWENRPVEIRFVSMDEARTMGLRKLPPREGEIRLIGVKDFDLCACGGTHVARTGQIGSVLIRKSEKVKQGVRVEFVCGLRAVGTARHDFQTLTDAAALFSTHIYEVPVQIAKAQEESKAGARRAGKLLEEIAGYEAAALVASAERRGDAAVAVKTYADRDAAFIKLVAQKFTAATRGVILLGALQGQPTIVLSQTAGLPHNCGTLLKEALAVVGARGGGPKDMAQGGTPDAAKLEAVMADLAGKLRSNTQ